MDTISAIDVRHVVEVELVAIRPCLDRNGLVNNIRAWSRSGRPEDGCVYRGSVGSESIHVLISSSESHNSAQEQKVFEFISIVEGEKQLTMVTIRL